MAVMGRSVFRLVMLALLVSSAGCAPRPAAELPSALPEAPRHSVVTAPAEPSVQNSEPVATDEYSDPSDAYVQGLPKGKLVGLHDEERRLILDAARGPVESDLGQPVLFVVDRIRTAGDFAALRGRPVQRDGQPIDYLHTKHADAVKAGAFDDGVIVLLERQGGRWKVIEFRVGGTDWPGSAWLYEHTVPADLWAWD